MKYIIDTNILLWFLQDNPQLPIKFKEIIEGDNIIFISIASLWEISIKSSLGKLQLQTDFHKLFPSELEKNLIEIIPIEIESLYALIHLPFHHSDPFDRIIISQSLSKNIPVLYTDRYFKPYF